MENEKQPLEEQQTQTAEPALQEPETLENTWRCGRQQELR